jgi:hypothetical protein
MKKLVYGFIITILISSFSLVFANSGPVFWRGYPSSDIMTVDKNSPIEVKSENLTFDFSDEDNDSYSVIANVTAEYEMTNPTTETHFVQMAFPYIEKLNNTNYDDIKITSDGKELPYELYIGKSLNSYGSNSEENIKEKFNFDEIVNSLSNDMFEAKSFNLDEIGKLYYFEIKPTTNEGIDFTVDFTYDQEKTKIFIKNFNSFNRNEGNVRIASGCFDTQVAEIYVLGEDIDLNIKGYTIGSSKEETNLFTYEKIEKEVDIKTYLLDNIKEHSYANFEHISDIQLYNLYASALDKCFVYNLGFCSEDDVFAENSIVRIITLVYIVEFLPDSDHKVSVSYRTKGTMDKRNTIYPQYLFDYILNPAENWNSFNNLNIKIITPKVAPYIIDSSIKLNKEEGNIYNVNFERLPDEDLSFTLYSKEKITFLDKIEGKINRSFGYFAPIVIGIILIIALIVVISIVSKIKSKR